MRTNRPYDVQFYKDFRRPIRNCKVCGVSTRNFKDYCTEHVNTSPYIEELLVRMSKRSDQGLDSLAL
jgi:hypothetical protein